MVDRVLKSNPVAPSQSALLSREDKHLAAANVAGLGMHFAFTECIDLSTSSALKTATIYLNFLARGINFIWKQQIVGSLPLAQKSLFLKKAVSPEVAAVSHGAAFLVAGLGDEYANAVGSALCKISPVASAAVVGHHALQKLGRCVTALPQRPLEAITAIPIHLFNLLCETARMITSGTNHGMQQWNHLNEFFTKSQDLGAQFLHGVSNPALKILSNEVKSKENLGKITSYLQNLKKTDLFTASSADELLQQGLRFDQQLKQTLQQFKSLSYMSWQDDYKSKSELKETISSMNAAWHEAWQRLADTQKSGLQQTLQQAKEGIQIDERGDVDQWAAQWERSKLQTSKKFSDPISKWVDSLAVQDAQLQYLSNKKPAESLNRYQQQHLPGEIMNYKKSIDQMFHEKWNSKFEAIVQKWQEKIPTEGVLEKDFQGKNCEQLLSTATKWHGGTTQACFNQKIDGQPNVLLERAQRNWLSGQIQKTAKKMSEICLNIFDRVETAYKTSSKGKNCTDRLLARVQSDWSQEIEGCANTKKHKLLNLKNNMYVALFQQPHIYQLPSVLREYQAKVEAIRGSEECYQPIYNALEKEKEKEIRLIPHNDARKLWIGEQIKLMEQGVAVQCDETLKELDNAFSRVYWKNVNEKDLSLLDSFWFWYHGGVIPEQPFNE